MKNENSLSYIAGNNDANAKLVLAPDSVTTIANNTAIKTSAGTLTIQVANYDNDTHTITPVSGATATVIIHGTTIHVSGSGTYINADGTTDMHE